MYLTPGCSIFTHSDWIRRDTFTHTSLYSVRMRENTDQNNSEYEHFSRNVFDAVPPLRLVLEYFWVDSWGLSYFYSSYKLGVINSLQFSEEVSIKILMVESLFLGFWYMHFYFIFLSGFSYTFTGQQRKGANHLYSFLPFPLAHEQWNLYVQLLIWDDSDVFLIVSLTAQKMKFSKEDFFSKCGQICRFLRVWSYLVKKSFMENFIFCAACNYKTTTTRWDFTTLENYYLLDCRCLECQFPFTWWFNSRCCYSNLT